MANKIQYGKVIDNFAENDKGKEKYIGQVGRVLKIETDYYCFSQVQLQFEDGSIEWFSNTTLEEVDKDGNLIIEQEEPTAKNIFESSYRITVKDFIRIVKEKNAPMDAWLSIKDSDGTIVQLHSLTLTERDPEMGDIDLVLE